MTPEKGKPPRVGCLAAETQGGLDDASGLPSRLDRYSRAHHRALDMADYARSQGEVKTALNLAACGHHLLFRDYYKVGKVRLHAARFCRKHLLCPLCAIRRGAKLVQAYMDRLKVILADNPGLRASLLTVTVKNGEDLQERFLHCQRAFQRLQQARRSYLRGKGPYVELAKVEGAVGAYEFKRGANSGQWHPHIHVIVLHRADLDRQRLMDDWLKHTGDSFMVHVRPFDNQEDPVDGFLEVFKYAVKFSELPLEDNWQGFQTLSGRRLVFSFGLFRGVEVPDELTDEGLDDQPFVELLYRFAKGSGYHVEKVSERRPPARAPQRSEDAACRTEEASNSGKEDGFACESGKCGHGMPETTAPAVFPSEVEVVSGPAGPNRPRRQNGPLSKDNPKSLRVRRNGNSPRREGG